MAELTPQTERQAAFDTYIAASQDMLTHTDLRQRIDAPTFDMLNRTIDNAFLPNVSPDGTVRLPDEQRGTSNLAILPKIASDQERPLQFAGSMFEPTQHRLEIIHGAIGQKYGGTIDDTRRRYASRGLDLSRTHQIVDAPRHKGMTGLHASTYRDKDEPLYVARPHTILPEQLIRAPRAIQAATVLHEAVHGDDIEQIGITLGEDELLWNVRSELRANSVGIRCLEAAGIVADSDIVRGNGLFFAVELERHRRQLNPADDPYAPHSRLIPQVVRVQTLF